MLPFEPTTIKDDIKEMMCAIHQKIELCGDIPQYETTDCAKRFTASYDTWRVSCRYSLYDIDILLTRLHKAQNSKAHKPQHPTKGLRSYVKTTRAGMIAAQKRVTAQQRADL